MANPEHVQLLQQGDWNKWRVDHPDDIPDLSGADLHEANLNGAYLSGADLHEANLHEANLSSAHLSGAVLRHAHLSPTVLRHANLSEANLFQANLIEADLRRANLRGADLKGAVLNGANLSGADLKRADLRGAKLRANLSDANLSEADLHEANLYRASLIRADLTQTELSLTNFGGTNLREAKGLAECRFAGPCILDILAIQYSGVLPLPFLRGCGLPDSLIEYLPSILNQAIQFFSCFISYSTKDQEFADRLYADLQNKGVRCWFAPEDLKIGDPFRQRIDESIRLHDKLLLALSEQSVQSSWVQDEVEAALERERRENRLVLFPIRIDDAVMQTNQAWAAAIRRTRHIGDFSKWQEHESYKKAFERLLRDLKAGAGKQASTSE